MPGGEVVEGQEFVAVLDQAFDGLGVFRAVGVDKQFELLAGIFPGLGLPDVVQRLLCLGLTALWQIVQNVSGLMHPAPLLPGGGIDFLKSCPKSHGSIADRQFRSVEAAAFEPQQDLAPALGAFPHAVLNGQELLFAARIDADHDQGTEPVICAAQDAVNPVGPDIDPFITAKIGFAPGVVLGRPLRFRSCLGSGGNLKAA